MKRRSQSALFGTAVLTAFLTACGGGGASSGPSGGEVTPPAKVDHQAWFENADSITLKTGMVSTYGLGGVSVWSLGNDDASLWTAVAAGLPKTSTKICLGYLPNYAATSGFLSVQQNKTVINAVADFAWSVDGAGAVTGAPTPNLITYGNANAIKVYLCLKNDTSASTLHTIVTTGKTAAIANLVSAVETNGYAGVNLDVEGFDKADRDGYSSFAQGLATALHAKSLKLIISVPAKSSDNPDDSWSGGFDYAALGTSADYLQVMTYDEHGPWGAPGSVAGADWMGTCLAFAITKVTPSKVLMGLPAYGYDWQKDSTGAWIKGTGDGSFAWKDIPALLSQTGAIPQWDTASKSAFITYQK